MSIASLICVSLFLGTTVAIVFPQHNCSEYFTYGMGKDGSSIGVFTAKKGIHTPLNFSVTFALKGSAKVTPIEPYPELPKVRQNIKLGLRAQTFVRFVNVTEMMPVPIKFFLNNELLCNTTIPESSDFYHEVPVEIEIDAPENNVKGHGSLPRMQPIFPEIQPTIYIE
uniref:Uncharacterized protein LOC108052412 n=1 Tax=Drosophila rhopaloa TaxID=1041015 RepID=A0A6P4FKB3_DRORH